MYAYLLCRSDCVHILNHCVDDSKQTFNIGALCDLLPVSDSDEECISLSQFTGMLSVSEQLVFLSNLIHLNTAYSQRVALPTSMALKRLMDAFALDSACSI